MDHGKVVLAYSGGLDTSVAVKWLQENYQVDVVTVTVDLGMVDLESVKKRALDCGAVKAIAVDGKETFIKDFVFPSLRAGAIYQDQYPLCTALGRPLIAKYMTEVAKQEGASSIAHGCTGKGNDQVRIEVSIGALDPSLKIIAPIREWGMSREAELEYAKKHNIPVQAKNTLYSTDDNLWGRSIEAGSLENPWEEPSEDAFEWTKSIEEATGDPLVLEVDFLEGTPIALNRKEINHIDLVTTLNDLAGQHGFGRIDHLEDRLVGIKSREVYETPAALVLHKAHKALENMTLTKAQQNMKHNVAQEYADLVYNGLWFSAHRHDLDSYVQSTQRYVTGTVRLKLSKGNCIVIGRKSPYSLYEYDLATYDKGDTFDHSAAKGFIDIWGLSARTQSKTQNRDIDN